MYKNFEWRTFALNGAVRVLKGLYFICDGGYHYWKELIPPYKHQVDGTKAKRWWSKWVESLRKDVECSFGIMKKRFQSIKNRSRYHNKETLETVFFCCAILHNMNHHYDQYDEKLHDALELEHIREFQSNIEENEIELEDEDDFWNRRSALIDHYIYNRDVLKTDFERHRSIT
mmetsp:Transcript_1820/g.4132  ORF Transcript_1820/g.4132 Transcript_1820/m.4132 type:complete len:173 (-) Transcript_1820:1203-1721(-)